MKNKNDIDKLGNNIKYSEEDKIILKIVNSISKEDRDLAVKEYKEFLGQV